MILNNLKNIILPVSILAGMIIGVGFFSLPYITSKVGFPLMLFFLLFLGIIITKINLIFGEIALETPDFKRIPGFAKFHLGKWGETISLFFSIFWGIGGIVAYIVVGGSFLRTLFYQQFELSNNIYTLIYFLFGSIFIFFGINAISKLNLWALGFLFLVFIAMFKTSSHLIEIDNLFVGSIETINDLLLPYGAVLYSLWGASLIPNVEEMLAENKRLIKKTIIIASIIPIIVYLLFIYLVLGLRGINTSPTALIGLESHIEPEMVNLALVLGLLTTFTSYVSSGLVLKDILTYDLKIEKNISWFIACFTPLALFLLGINDFIEVINLLGGVGLGVNGSLILLIYKKLKDKKGEKIPFWIYSFFLIFALGIVYELINFLT